jgi:hypothetical protein
MTHTIKEFSCNTLNKIYIEESYIVTLSNIMQNITTSNVIKISVIMLSIVILYVSMVSVIMLSGLTLIAVMPNSHYVVPATKTVKHFGKSNAKFIQTQNTN